MELAHTGFSCRKSYRHGIAAAFIDGDYHGDQSEIFYQRFPESAAQSSQYGYTGGVGQWSGLCIQYGSYVPDGRISGRGQPRNGGALSA